MNYSAPALKRFGMLCGASSAMEELYRQAERVAHTDATILLAGESGTGKELLAQTIHQLSERRCYPFIAVNCGAIPMQLIESILFGHEKGSFTGAVCQHVGFFEHASHGTLFLDEITEMPADMQVKLLRVLEGNRFMRIGSVTEVVSDVRVIAATNRELDTAVRHGHLRADLMYRLAVFPMRLPPLRERGDDIELLAEIFLEELNANAHARKVFSRNAFKFLHDYPWPGNVRELKNIVQRAFILAGDIPEIDLDFKSPSGRHEHAQTGCLNFRLGTPLAEVQREVILATLKHFDGNKRLTAHALGISLKTLYNRLRET